MTVTNKHLLQAAISDADQLQQHSGPEILAALEGIDHVVAHARGQDTAEDVQGIHDDLVAAADAHPRVRLRLPALLQQGWNLDVDVDADQETDDQDDQAPPESLEDLNADQVRQLASQAEITGRSSMNKGERIEALREAGVTIEDAVLTDIA